MTRTRRRAGLFLIAVAIAATVAVTSAGAPAASPTEPTLASAVTLAKRYVVRRYHLSGLYSVVAMRSKRDPTWADVNGYYRRPRRSRLRVWAVWLQVRNDAWRVAYSGINFRAATAAGEDVPCDIEPAFSEPEC